MKTYSIFTIKRKDIEDAISHVDKQLKSLSDDDVDYQKNRRAFNKMKREIKEHPSTHYNKIVNEIRKEAIGEKFNGRFLTLVKQYMVSPRAKTEE